MTRPGASLTTPFGAPVRFPLAKALVAADPRRVFRTGRRRDRGRSALDSRRHRAGGQRRNLRRGRPGLRRRTTPPRRTSRLQTPSPPATRTPACAGRPGCRPPRRDPGRSSGPATRPSTPTTRLTRREHARRMPRRRPWPSPRRAGRDAQRRSRHSATALTGVPASDGPSRQLRAAARGARRVRVRRRRRLRRRLGPRSGHAGRAPASASPGTARPRGSSRLPRQQHHEAVDPHADPARGRHALLERAHEVLVVGLGLLVALGRVAALLLEAGALLVGVVELGEGVGELHPAGEALEALHQAGLGAVGLGEGRQLHRVVDDEGGVARASARRAWRAGRPPAWPTCPRPAPRPPGCRCRSPRGSRR